MLLGVKLFVWKSPLSLKSTHLVRMEMKLSSYQTCLKYDLVETIYPRLLARF